VTNSQFFYTLKEGRYGLMRLAFFCWGSSVLALVYALGSPLQTLGGNIGRW
jgi:hypothetical protein